MDCTDNLPEPRAMHTAPPDEPYCSDELRHCATTLPHCMQKSSQVQAPPAIRPFQGAPRATLIVMRCAGCAPGHGSTLRRPRGTLSAIALARRARCMAASDLHSDAGEQENVLVLARCARPPTSRPQRDRTRKSRFTSNGGLSGRNNHSSRFATKSAKQYLMLP